MKKFRKQAVLKTQELEIDNVILYAMDEYNRLIKEAEWMASTRIKRWWYGSEGVAKVMVKAQIWAAIYKCLESYKAILSTKTK